MDRVDFLKQQIERCRRLALGADDTTAHALSELAAECEAELAKLTHEARQEMPLAQ